MNGTCFLYFALFFLLQVLICCFAMAVAVSADIATDETALLALKAHITSDPHNILATNWSTNSSLCSWTGVTCGGTGFQRRVTALKLSHMGFNGTIPSQIGNLTFLDSVSIRNNSFYGSLPNELAHLLHLNYLDFGFNFFNGSIPPGLGSLPKLRSLLLESNNFMGNFPLSLANITSLQVINASHNQLSGFTPSKLLNLSSLQTIDLSFNDLSGLAVDVFNHLPKLQELYLSGNQFYGEIPISLFECRQLQVLSLSDNKFKGSIPAEIGNLTVLEKLYLDHNDFNGTIPQEIGYLTKMENLSLSNNHITGSIPRSIGNCTLIKEINISNNNLTGAIPSEIRDLTNLEIVRLHGNALSGNIPSVLFNISTMKAIALHANCLSGSLSLTIGLFLPNLMELRLWGNELEGTIASSIANASMLTVLDLSYNSFVGFIPSTLGSLRNLQVLNLANNILKCEGSTLEVCLFSSLMKCKNLRRIDLSGNPLNTTLSISSGNLSTSLQQFWANNCDLKGGIPGEIGNLTSLIALSLGNNEMTGTIPTTIGNLKKLQGLHLHANNLLGTIPYDLCGLDNLADLSLGANKLSGSIPECLGNLETLRQLNLSSNNLTSAIPLTLWNLKDILVINISSNSLNGSLPLDIHKLQVVTEIDLSRNQISGTIPSNISNLKSLAYLSLSKNGLQGSIPQLLNGLVSLEFLDLSCNYLTGAVPKSLEALTYLEYFNVSFNKLQGEIPNGGPFIKFSSQSYLMNDALCGAARLQVSPCKAGGQRGSAKRLAFLLSLTLPLIAFAMVPLYIFICLRFPKRAAPSSSTPTIQKSDRYTYGELQRATDGFGEGNLLGKGSCGLVYKGILRDGKVVAIKVFNVEEEASVGSFYVERRALDIASHPNLITVFWSLDGINFKALVMEYMVNGSLEKWLYTHNYHLDILQRLDIMIDIASAVGYLHDSCEGTIIHCDLKPSNILLDEDMVARVSDFSIAKIIDSGQRDFIRESNVACTMGYVAPETGLFGMFSTKTDVYSFGIMLMETFTGKMPTDEMFTEEMSLRCWVMKSLPHELDRIIDPSLLRIGEEQYFVKVQCLIDIMTLGLNCSDDCRTDRLNMNAVVDILEDIRRVFLKNIYHEVVEDFNIQEIPASNRSREIMRKFTKWRRHNLQLVVDFKIEEIPKQSILGESMKKFTKWRRDNLQLVVDKE